MSRWFAVNLGDAMLAGEALEDVRSKFVELTDNANDAAVLMRHESDGRLHCELWLYFPPELATLAASIGARPCDPPSAHGMGLLIGDRNWLARLASGDGPADD